MLIQRVAITGGARGIAAELGERPVGLPLDVRDRRPHHHRDARPNASGACSRANELKSCPVSVTGRGWNNPTGLPGSSSRSCVSGLA